MPLIPQYERKYTVPAEGPNVLQDVGSAGIVGAAVAKFGKTALSVADDVGDIIIKREKELKDQATDNLLIQKGAEFDQEWQDTEIQLKKDYKGNEASGVRQKGEEWIKQASERYSIKDNEKAHIKLQQHIMSRRNQLANSLAGHEAQEIKIAATNVRNYTLETSMKEAQLNPANVVTAVATYERALDSQLANKSITSEEYAILKKTGVSQIREANIEAIQAYDPVSAQNVYNSVKGDLTVQTQERLDKTLKPSVTRQTALAAATEIYKADPTAPAETLIDKAKARKDLTPEGIDLTIQHIKDQVAVAHADKERARVQTNTVMYQKIAEANIARGGNGLNKLSDISPADQARWAEKDPVAYNAWVDGVRKDTDYQLRLEKADRQNEGLLANELKRERAAEQADRVTELLIMGPENADLKAELANGRISNTHYNMLRTRQEAAEKPYNDLVSSMLKKVPAAVPTALGIDPKKKNEVQAWTQKFQDLIKIKAENLQKDPNRDQKLSEYFDQHVAAEIVRDWFEYVPFVDDKADAAKRKLADAAAAAGTKVIKGTPLRQKPTEEQYIAAARKNPAFKSYTDDQLKKGYQRDYGDKN